MSRLRARLRDQRGVIGLLTVLTYSAIILVIGSTMVASAAISYQISNKRITSTQSIYHAESGAEDALLQIKRDASYGSSLTTLTTTFDANNRVDTEVDTVGGQGCSTAKQVTAAGFVKQQVRKIQLTNCPQPSPNIDFVYALQAGAGGINMNNNAVVNGTTYSNGNHTAGNNALVTGDAWVAGGAAADASPVFDPESVTDHNVGRNPTNDVAQSFTAPDNEKIIKFSLKVKKVGSPGNATVRLTADNANKPSTSTLASGTLTASTVGSGYSFIDVSMSTNPNLTSGTKYWVVIDGGANNSNYYQWASNNSYASHEAKYSSNFSGGTWTAANTDMAFKVWTGGLPTSISGLTIGGHAHANTLTNDAISGDAYYQTKTGGSVGGTSYPGSADPPTRDLPVTEANVNDFKALASAGTIWNGDYTVSGGQSAIIGPMKITGNLLVDNNATLTMTGTVWVVGNATFNNNATLRLDPGYGPDSGAIVTDGIFTLNNNVIVQGSGNLDSFVMGISTSNASNAITIYNNATSIILATINGTIYINNNGGANAISAYRLNLENNATVTYLSGLADTQFSAGPGGSFQAGGWQEVVLD